MKRRILALPILCATLFTLAVFGSAPAASADDDTGWRLKFFASATQPTSGGSFNLSPGGGLAVEYRANRRLGFELSGMYTRLESEIHGEVFAAEFTIQTRLESTPLLARLNWHLTPDARADFYGGPVAGWVRYGSGVVRVLGDVEAIEIFIPEFEAEDAFVYGVHAGVDVPVGSGRWFVTGGLTYLENDVDSAITDQPLFEIDPLTAHAGLGLRF